MVVVCKVRDCAMLIVKYTKTGSACYVSHVDTLRTVNRTFSRANVSVDYSEGFKNATVMVADSGQIYFV